MQLNWIIIINANNVNAAAVGWTENPFENDINSTNV